MAANGVKVKTSAAGTSDRIISAEESEKINDEIPAGGRKNYNHSQRPAAKSELEATATGRWSSRPG